MDFTLGKANTPLVDSDNKIAATPSEVMKPIESQWMQNKV